MAADFRNHSVTDRDLSVVDFAGNHIDNMSFDRLVLHLKAGLETSNIRILPESFIKWDQVGHERGFFFSPLFLNL